MSTESHPAGERIAKVIARSGRASRREAEALIAAGRVAVNGKVIARAALNVGPKDHITVDGTPLAAPEPARLWLYHKPTGLVTTTRDEQGRATIYDALPPDMPRVMSVGRLDLNSEGLLLLTNDGALKRQLELPSTGWLRKYRVRVNGRPDDARLAPLRQGIEIEGEKFQPMSVTLDRQQGANAWLTIGLREGKNREIRRAMEAVGLTVNRLIRVSYGPFQLGQLKPGQVEEVRRRVLRDQLGLNDAQPDEDEKPAGKKPGAKPGAKSGAKPAAKPGAKPGAKSGAKPGAKPRSISRPARAPRSDPGFAAGFTPKPRGRSAKGGTGAKPASPGKAGPSPAPAKPRGPRPKR